MKCQEHLRRNQESETVSVARMQAACNRTTAALASLSIASSSDFSEVNYTSLNETQVEKALNATARVHELLIIMLDAFDVQQLRSLEMVEEALHFTGLAIICIFVVEVTLKLVAFFPEFFRSKIDVCDMLLVYISFLCELALSVSDVRVGVREAVFVAMLLRLWRIARIVSGVVISMKAKYEGEITRLKAKLKAAQGGSRSSLCTGNQPNQRMGFFKSRHMSEANFQLPRSYKIDEARGHSRSGPNLEEDEPETPQSPLEFETSKRHTSTGSTGTN